MIEPFLVCPFNEKLISGLKQRAIVVNTEDVHSIRHIYAEVNKANKLHAIKISTGLPISEIDFQETWKTIPLAIYAPQLGDYKEFLHRLSLLRSLNARIFLSTQYEFNFIALKILSTLNINCGLYFGRDPRNWDAINDLMQYAIYNKVKHAPIEPFHWLASHYEPTEYTDFSIVYFNNPARYLHLNNEGQIALTEEDLEEGRFIGEGIGDLDTITSNIQYKERLNNRYDSMLSMNECAFCVAFRICLAKFPGLENKSETCKRFFQDFLDAADYHHLSKSRNGNQLWQL